MFTRRDFLASGLAGLTIPSISFAQEKSEAGSLELFNQFNPEQIVQNNGSDIFTRHVRFAGVKLKCLMDISPSITPKEYNMQKIGTARALKSDRVKSAIHQQGGIVFSLSEFSWLTNHRIPWATLQTDEDIELMSHLIETMPLNPLRNGTALSSGIDNCRRHFNQSTIPVAKQVLDISGDGGDNRASPHAQIAADLVRSSSNVCAYDGIVCNGITLPTDSYSNLPPHISSIGQYYREYVQTPANFTYSDQYGGTQKTPEGFVVEVNQWEAFEEAMTEKLRSEIIGSLPARPHLRFG